MSSFTELELWLIGTPEQLDAAITALQPIGRHVLPSDPAHHPQRTALEGRDKGRYRFYLRLAVTTTHATDRPSHTTRTGGQVVLDLDSYRRTA